MSTRLLSSWSGASARRTPSGSTSSQPDRVARNGAVRLDLSADGLVFGLDQATLVRARGDVAEEDIAAKRAEEGNALADEHGHTGDDEAVDEAGGEESADGNAAVDVGVPEGALFEAGDDFCGLAGHLFDHAIADPGKIERLGAEDDDRLLSEVPLAEAADDVKGAAAHDNDVDGRKELLVAVGRLAAGVEEVEAIVGAGEETIGTDSAKDGKLHGAPRGGESDECREAAERSQWMATTAGIRGGRWRERRFAGRER